MGGGVLTPHEEPGSHGAETSPVLRLRVLAAMVLVVVLGSAALERLGGADPVGPLSEVEVEAAARTMSPVSALLLGRRIPLDAPAEAWAQLPGIGARTAQAIVAAQLQHPSELSQVRGIGARRAASLSGWVRAAH
jgi:hypothetical protein